MPVKAKLQGEITKGMKLSAFLENMDKSETDVFFTADLIRIYESGNGVRKNAHSVRAISGGAYTDYPYKSSTYRKDKNGISWGYIQSTRFEGILEKHVNSLKKLGIKNYADLSSGWNIPSDTRRPLLGEMTHTTRDVVLKNYISAYEKIKPQTESMLFDGGLGYTFGYATDITALPNNSSRYDVFDRDIPFVQMILHGYVNYSAKPVNLSADYKTAVLKSIEYGAIPTYSVIFENEERISETPYNDRYSAKYSDWKEEIVNTNIKLKELSDKTVGASITNHQAIDKDVYKISYDNGSLVFVNYGKSDVVVNDKTIPAEDFAVFAD